MTILITGGAGFIGSKIVSRLSKLGHNVIVIDNLFTGDKEYISDVKCKFYCYDITNSSEIMSIFGQHNIDIVIHLAANSRARYSVNHSIEDANINIIGSINILNACIKYSVKKIIYFSTGGARYGEYKGLIDETFEPQPIIPYGISKHTVEHYLYTYNKIYGLKYISLCLGNVFGEGDDPTKTERIIPILICGLLTNKEIKIFGSGDQKRDFIYIEDLLNLIINLVENVLFTNKIYNISTGHSYSVNYIINKLEFLSGIKMKLNYINELICEIDENTLSSILAEKELDWESTILFDDALKRTYNWWVKKLDKNIKGNCNETIGMFT